MTSVFLYRVPTVDEINSLVKLLVQQLLRPAIVLLSGNLAAGKTTLVAEFCKHFGLNVTQSPTYAIHQQYVSHEIKVDHFDLYRLESEDDIQASGFYDLLSEKADYKFIEWGERVELRNFTLDVPLYKINIQVNSDGSREFELFKLN